MMIPLKFEYAKGLATNGLARVQDCALRFLWKMVSI